MVIREDEICARVVSIINSAGEPLETKEVEQRVREKLKSAGITRTKIFYRLNLLRGDGAINGKFIGPGKGVWIWWKKEIVKK